MKKKTADKIDGLGPDDLKRIHKAVYNPQLNMFANDDQWGTDVLPHQIKPFERRVELA
jgi:hypothetical protein